jgi:hypothetical protein
MCRITALAVVSIIVLMFASSVLAGEHEIGVFVGDTRHQGVSALTLGADYEYRWNSTAGIGLLFEYVQGNRHTREYIFGVPFYAHPYGGLRLCFAPLFISEDEDGTSVNRGGVRVGVAYAIEAGGFNITPQFDFDFLSERVYTVYGIGFGYRF